MPGFRYQAYNVEGKLHKGVLEADSARQARAQLRDQGLTPYRVEVIAANDPAGGSRFRAVSLSSTELTQLTRQLASLLEASLTVEQAFNALIEQAENERMRQVLAALRGEVLAGNTIAKALANFPGVFPELYRTLVAAGETSGQLPRVLLRLADYLEDRQQMRSKLALALVYPAIVFVVALGVVGALLVYVVPQVVTVFQHAHQQLPILTRVLIGFSSFLSATWMLWVALVVAGGIGLKVALDRPAPRAAVHRFAWRLPVIGRLLRSLDSARLAATLSILVGSRVPILQALEAGTGVMTLTPMREALATAARGVREGMPLSRALGATQAFPPVMVHLIASGEASGKLDESLERAARTQQNDLATRLAAFAAIFEPAMILLMGAIVLFIVMSILLPIFQLNQLIGK
ncbi:type II secretion system inner membrane protein GspF [Usitatibacter palustris]|uniref:General secretion pathway protein F n=1 Tax=Usitatibacter palustris TaxID=2732487 RepID=A0A6M4H849_9PROT|nr:type II secretion system inner membrane protein GspF [Usitatibacter palustris]QJR15760.1 Type II secretion system protein F [Usitatibacter palustris]